jgi:GT2 family glycosyltransferase
MGDFTTPHTAGASGMEAPGAAPLISVVLPTYDPEEAHLREAIDSVRGQSYPQWQLCIADDASTRPWVRHVLDEYASADPRIEVELLSENSGISAVSNRALAICRGEYVAFLDHDDALTPDALFEAARVIDADPSVDVIYSDQDKLAPDGRAVDPFLKPDPSPVYALGAMYIGHLLVVRRSVVEQAGGFDSSFDTIQDFELFLRVSEQTDRIHHVPRILYHWRAIPGSIAAGTDEKSGVPELQARAVTAHLRRRGIPASAVPHPEIPHRARLVPDPRSSNPLVSVVVAWGGDERDIVRCLDSLFERTTYPSFEVVVVECAGTGEAFRTALRHPVVRVPAGPSPPPSPVASNLGVGKASGEYVVLLADDAEIAEGDWMEQLLMYAEMPSVGAVGPLVLHPDGRVEHAGVALGVRGTADHMMRGFPGDGDGYYGSLPCAREVAAVSAACMLIPRSLYLRIGGFREDYRMQYHDVDLCLRVRQEGLEIVYAPWPRIVRHESSPPESRYDLTDRALFVDTWYEELERGDPYFNPHFSRDDANYSLHAWPGATPRSGAEVATRR